MEQYIPKSTLMAEIESRMSDIKISQKAGLIKKYNAETKIIILKSILSLINTLEVKEDGEKPATKDLGEYIYELSKQFPEVSFAKLSRIAVRVAKWQKEQMMAKAIKGIARPDDNEIWCNLASSNLKDDDEVKVIVIKEE